MNNSPHIPPAPDLVLRIGFAGIREVPADTQPLRRSLNNVFGILAARLVEISEEAHAEGRQSKITHYYSRREPTLRLITGLAEGADAIAIDALERIVHRQVKVEQAAILPFNLRAYRDSREPGFRTTFDKFAKQCAYVVALDGHYGAGQAGKASRSLAYRAQSTLLLRQSDMLLAVADPEQTSRPGGTLETVRAALGLGIPVVLILAAGGEVQLLQSDSALAAALATVADAPGWADAVRSWIDDIVADPDSGSTSDAGQGSGAKVEPAVHGQRLMEEFLLDGNLPPLRVEPDGSFVRKRSWRERLWTQFEGSFRPTESPPPDLPIDNYNVYRLRATSLNYHYSGLYRGTFLLNYVLAVVAVALAALSLVLLDRVSTNAASEFRSALAVSVPASGLLQVLLVLGLVKLAVVYFIFRNTHQANHGDWNDKAVDYRYLAERLRSMFYLARAGNFQPPPAGPPRYASRVVRQSAVEWLFKAIVRAVPPSVLPSLKETVMPEDGTSYAVAVIHIDPAGVLGIIRDRWLGGQIAYHNRNAKTMGRLSRFAELWGKRLSLAVITAVAIDVSLLVTTLLHLLPRPLASGLHLTAPALMFLAALLPAAVASLNGIRFQSECGRLADRSAVVRAILDGRLKEAISLTRKIEKAQENHATEPGAWSVEVLRLSEATASDLVQEVAEWAVLYTKELVEP